MLGHLGQEVKRVILVNMAQEDPRERKERQVMKDREVQMWIRTS